MTTCFGYVRVSTQKQGDGASLAAQKDAIMAFASQNGLVVKKWFEELETASKRGRPIFDDMIKQLNASRAQGVIVHRWDRSTRNFSDWATISDLADQGVKVFCAGDNVDFNSRGGRLMADIQMVLATDYSRNLSLEVKKGQRQRLKEGHWPWRAPFGYLDNGEGALKTPCPVNAPLIKELFRLYLSKEHSFNSLTDRMSERGLMGFNGRQLSRRNVENVLKNAFYCGQLVCKQGVFKGSHEPLISVTEFKAIARIRADRYSKRVTKHRHAFSGIFTCGQCGAGLIGERQRNKVYYRCHTRICEEKCYREDKLLEMTTTALGDFEWGNDQVTRFYDDLKSRDLFAEQDAQQTSLNLRAAAIQARQSRLTDLYLDASVTEAEFNMRKKQLALDLALIDEQRGELQRTRRNRADLNELVEFASSITTVFAVASDSERRQLLREWFMKRTVQKGAVSLTPAATKLSLASGATKTASAEEVLQNAR